MSTVGIIAVEAIQKRILLIRGERVMLDQDLAELYGVDTRQLTRQVRRNHGRFPGDFAFQLTRVEFDAVKATMGEAGWGGRRFLPWVFTEQGVAMLSSVLHSPQAIEVNVQIMRAFVQLRSLLSSSDASRRQLADIELRLTEHDGYFRSVFEAIRRLMEPAPSAKVRRIGFRKSDAGET